MFLPFVFVKHYAKGEHLSWKATAAFCVCIASVATYVISGAVKITLVNGCGPTGEISQLRTLCKYFLLKEQTSLVKEDERSKSVMILVKNIYMY